ncbi:hypothetical protein BGZ50_002846 [Haplosporangium sp. Z 11]|nr:hypothetical protein BGZ50_002846 [Haplosporangium sp. Z 11]
MADVDSLSAQHQQQDSAVEYHDGSRQAAFGNQYYQYKDQGQPEQPSSKSHMITTLDLPHIDLKLYRQHQDLSSSCQRVQNAKDVKRDKAAAVFRVMSMIDLDSTKTANLTTDDPRLDPHPREASKTNW